MTTDPQRTRASDSDLSTISVAEYRGMTVERVSTPDISDDDRDTQAAIQTEIASINHQLSVQSHWPPPALCTIEGQKRLQPNNPVAESLFTSAPGLRLWREKLVPTAVALTALYEAESWTLPTGEPIDALTRAYFIHSLDAIGIRSRAAIMSDIAGRHISSDTTRWTSIACGAAIPVLDAVDRHAAGRDVRLTLVDIDWVALEHASTKAIERGFLNFDLLNRNVIKDLIVTDRLVRELGFESQQLVDMLGIFEYIHEDFGGFKSAAAFLTNAFRLVRPGGALVAANMLDTHPQMHFNQRAIGWPRVFPRSLDQIHDIVVDAGIDPRWVTVRIAEDGIYAVFEILKPNPTDADEPVAA